MYGSPGPEYYTQKADDIRPAHQWATQALADAVPGSLQEYELKQERKRLAAIYADCKQRSR